MKIYWLLIPVCAFAKKSIETNNTASVATNPPTRVLSQVVVPSEAVDTQSLIMPRWESCPHTSANSYINFTFSPYPIRRGQALNVTLQGNIDVEITEGITLEMSSWHMSIPLIRGPSFEIDVCDFIAKQYPNAPNIRCPITKWAIMLILYGIKESGGTLGPNIHVPKIVIPGKYKTVVKLRSKGQDFTCAQAIIVIK